MLLVGAFPNTESLSGSKAIGATIGLLILFGSAVSGWTYLISFFFSSPSGAQIFIIFLVRQGAASVTPVQARSPR